MSEKRTIRGLTEQGKKVYVFTGSEKLCRDFLSLAEQEGFTFGDGVKPTKKHSSDIFAVNSDGTISYVGTIGRTAIGSNAIFTVDFEKYISGFDSYVWKK